MDLSSCARSFCKINRLNQGGIEIPIGSNLALSGLGDNINLSEAALVNQSMIANCSLPSSPSQSPSVSGTLLALAPVVTCALTCLGVIGLFALNRSRTQARRDFQQDNHSVALLDIAPRP